MLRATRPMIAVEVGTWLGASAIHTAQLLKEWGGRLWCIDPWQAGWMEGDPTVESLEQDSFNRFCSNVWHSGVQDVITPLRGTSLNFSNLFQYDEVEWCYVDGSHNYEDVKQDLQIWWPRMRPGYYLCGDDYFGLGVMGAWHHVLGSRIRTNGDQLVWTVKDNPSL